MNQDALEKELLHLLDQFMFQIIISTLNDP
jgi:hypothetical protein